MGWEKWWHSTYDFDGKEGWIKGPRSSCATNGNRDLTTHKGTEMNAPKGWEETERAMCELEKMAFAKIMADVSMPDDSGPDYDSWLFHKAWQAAEVHEPQGLRREVQELLPLLLNGIMPNKEALHYLRDLAYAPPSQDDEPSYWLIKDHEKDQPFLVDNKDSLTDHLKVGYRIVAELYTRPSSEIGRAHV